MVYSCRMDATPNGPHHDDAFCIGNGSEIYCLAIRIDKVQGLHQLAMAPSAKEPVEAWLSYRYFDTIVQTKQPFQLDPTNSQQEQQFEGMADGFRVRGSVSELAAFFAVESNGILPVFLCVQGALLGSAKLDIGRLLSLGGDEDFAERTGRGEFLVKQHASTGSQDGLQGESHEGSSSSLPLISVAVSLKREDRGEFQASSTKEETFASSTTVSTQMSPKKPSMCRYQPPPQDPIVVAPAHDTSSSTNVSLADDRITFEKEKRKWEEWRHKEEIKWHRRMREQEAAATKSLQEQSRIQDRERDKAAETSRKEFVALETRLRKALAEVEKRGRRIRTLEASREAEYTTRMAEVQVKERLVKEETKHAAELEKLKVKAANEQAAAAEKATAAAEERAKKIEESYESFKKRQRESPEATLHQEIATLKGELAASESRINKERAEKNDALFEKEQHRANVHKLVRALKKEKQKVAALEEKDRSQLRLEHTSRGGGQCLAVGGNREELHRIKDELNSLSSNSNSSSNPQLSPQKEGGCVPARAAPACVKQSMTLSPQKPRAIPSPLTPPRHPASKSRQVAPNDENSHIHALSFHHYPQQRQVSSDSKLDRLRRERDGPEMMRPAAAGGHSIALEMENLLRPEMMR